MNLAGDTTALATDGYIDNALNPGKFWRVFCYSLSFGVDI